MDIQNCIISESFINGVSHINITFTSSSTARNFAALLPADALVDCAEFYLRLENFQRDQVLENRLSEDGSEE